ncbi:Hint domain-containing protein [Cysteiniphilum sp. 6C5]|uniref:Hint domain-containing protein n=1 Tax=unclassified Cysteiniphilum TaxID=2610889 RepID=UPI003F83569D
MKMVKKIFVSLVFCIGSSFSAVYGGPAFAACYGICLGTCATTCAAATGVAMPGCIASCASSYCNFLCAFAGFAACFSPSTKLITKENGVEIEKEVAKIRPNDQIKTMKEGKPFWTTVVKNTKTEGLFEYTQIKAKSSNNRNIQLEVTPNHGVIMLVDNNKTIDIAKNLVVGDNLLGANGETLSITEINTIFDQNKYTLETAEGSVLASNVFVSTICSDEVAGGEQLWDDKLKDWTQRHKDIYSADIVRQVFDRQHQVLP